MKKVSTGLFRIPRLVLQGSNSHHVILNSVSSVEHASHTRPLSKPPGWAAVCIEILWSVVLPTHSHLLISNVAALAHCKSCVSASLDAEV